MPLIALFVILIVSGCAASRAPEAGPTVRPGEATTRPAPAATGASAPTATARSEPPPTATTGEVPASFELEQLAGGGTFRLSDHLGHRPIVLNFWAPW